MAVLLFPGQLSAPVRLLDVLREAHEASRKARADELAARAKAGAPVDDETRWPVVSGVISAIGDAAGKQDSAALARLAGDLHRATAGNALEPIGDFVGPEGVDDLVVVFRVVSAADRLNGNAQLADAWQAVVDIERDGGPMVDRRLADERVLQAQLVICRDTIAEVRGVDVPVGADVWEGLRLAGLLPWLLMAARHFLALPAGKALRCGLPSSST
jgi:hypothetical protein